MKYVSVVHCFSLSYLYLSISVTFNKLFLQSYEQKCSEMHVVKKFVEYCCTE